MSILIIICLFYTVQGQDIKLYGLPSGILCFLHEGVMECVWKRPRSAAANERIRRGH